MGHKGVKWTGAFFIRGEAEGAGAVWPAEEMAQGDLTSVFKDLQGGSEDKGARFLSEEEALGKN